MKKILITGSDGLVGNGLKYISKLYQEFDFVFTTRSEYNLVNQHDVVNMLEKHKPDYVIHTAASVGGINKNLSFPADQFYYNILMNTFMIDECVKHNVSKLIVFSSACAFPENLEILSEDKLHAGPPYFAHESYAYTKRMVDIQIESYKKQYKNVNYCSIIPSNIFGEHDNYDLSEGHVTPSLIYKCFVAKNTNTPFEVWGSGNVYREFIYSRDLARACLDLLKIEILPQKIIISSLVEITIKELVNKICNIYDYHNVKWLTDKPSGQYRRPSNPTLFKNVLPNFEFSDIDVCLKNSVEWFVRNYPNVRGVHE